MKMKFLLSGLFALVSFSNIYSQAVAYSDPAKAYNKLLMDAENSTYTQVGNFKVIGSPYLYGPNHTGNMFAYGEMAYNITLSYNIYFNKIEFFSSANPNVALVKEFKEVDSFVLLPDKNSLYTTNLKFINPSVIGGTQTSFFQEIVKGSRISIYKMYTAKLDYVSTNYVQSELRQFEIENEYYYYDSKEKTIKKLKLNKKSVVKEFASIKDVSSLLDEYSFSSDPEPALIKVANFLNMEE